MDSGKGNTRIAIGHHVEVTQDHFLSAVKGEEGLTSRSCSEVFVLEQIQQECFLEK